MLKLLLTFLVFTKFVFALQRECVGKQLLDVNDENFAISKRNIRGLAKSFFGVTPKSVNLHNNGETVIIKFKYNAKKPYTDLGPYGDDIYKFEFLYFNWLREEFHMNRTLPFELHVVFSNNKYESFEQAATKNFGLTVWSFKYQRAFDEVPNELLRGIFESFNLIREPNTRTNYNHSLYKNIPPLFEMINTYIPEPYYFYLGGLVSSIHHCSADVIWLEFPIHAKISYKNFEGIKSLLAFNNASLMHQFPDSMPPNGVIYQSVEDNINFETDLFNATAEDIEDPSNGCQVHIKKFVLITMICLIYILISF